MNAYPYEELKNGNVYCKIEYIDCKKIRITGHIKKRDSFHNVLLIAANPIDKRTSYHGTGLPFPCADIAFEGTKNLYSVKESGIINVEFDYPNSYYSVADKKKLISSIFFVFETKDNKQSFLRFQLKDLYPLRTLINRETRTGPEFYETKHRILPLDTSFEIMKEYARIKRVLGLA